MRARIRKRACRASRHAAYYLKGECATLLQPLQQAQQLRSHLPFRPFRSLLLCSSSLLFTGLLGGSFFLRRVHFLLGASHAIAQVLHRAAKRGTKLRKVLGAKDKQSNSQNDEELRNSKTKDFHASLQVLGPDQYGRKTKKLVRLNGRDDRI